MRRNKSKSQSRPESYSAEDENHLMSRFNSGNPKAFEEVYLKLYNPVYFFACRLVGLEEAKDITADSFLQLFGRETQFASLQKIRTFLQVCVRNASINLTQKKQFREQIQESLFKHLNDQSLPNVQSKEVREDIFINIANEIEKLPPGARKVFHLSYIKGWNSKKIAKLMNISPSTVRNQKQRALDLIRNALKKSDLGFSLFFVVFYLHLLPSRIIH